MSPWTILAGVLLLAGVGTGGYLWGSQAEHNADQVKYEALQTSDAKALAIANATLANEESAAVAKQNAQAQHFAILQSNLEQADKDAKDKYDSDVASLKSGAERLRSEWSCTPSLAAGVAQAAASGSSNDAATLLREQDAANLVRIATDADNQIRYLQSVIASDRKQ